MGILATLRQGLPGAAATPRIPATPRSPLAQTLLDDSEVAALLREGQRQGGQPPALDSAHPLSGEHPSRFRGTGMDYEESRVYVPGDDLRHFNWRQFARTGQAYTRLFLDERRPAAFHVVDRRAGMRFGTRQRLKVTQAARATLLRAAAAHHQGMPVGGLLLNPEATPPARWIAPDLGQALHALVEAARAPCPPIEGPQIALGPLLRHLLVVLPHGSQLDLFSDFHDLSGDDRATLLALAQRHRVSAFLILDPAEHALPQAGHLSLRQTGGHQERDVDTADPRQRQAYRRAAQAHIARLTALFRQAGIALHALPSDTGDLRALCAAQPPARPVSGPVFRRTPRPTASAR